MNSEEQKAQQDQIVEQAQQESSAASSLQQPQQPKTAQQDYVEEDDDDDVPPENEDDIIYLDDEELEAMDQDEEEDDFQTINESELGDGQQYQEGQILAQEVVPDESIVKLAEVHKDSVFSINYLPREPFNTFVSGDCDDKAIVWKVVKDDTPEVEDAKQGEEQKQAATTETEQPRMKVKSVVHKYLDGHNETVEFIKFNHDGKLMATAGMNNQVRIWNTEADFSLKCTLEDGPTEDLYFIEWHPKGNVIIMGGKDLLIWMFNGQNGQFMSCLQGHQGDVYNAQFTINDQGKHILSSSSDKTIRLWAPMKQQCLQTIKAHQGTVFHDAEINVFAQHHERPLVISGDLQGKVFYSHYQTGEVGGMIGDHTDSVEAIAMSRHFPICVSAGIDTKLNIYDLTRTELRSKIEPSEYGGYSKIQFSECFPHVLLAASTLGDLHCIDVRDGKVVRTFRGNTGPINDMVEVKPLEIVATAGEDRECRIFDIRGLKHTA